MNGAEQAVEPDRAFIKKLSESSLHISRVDKKTKREFKAWAVEEFEDDWGMALKWLWDMYTGLLPPPESQITAVLEEFGARIDAVEAKLNSPEEKAIRMGDGSRIEKMR